LAIGKDMTGPNWKRPFVLEGNTIGIKTNCGTLHLIMNYDKDEKEGKLIEVIASIGKGGIACNSNILAITRLISIILQSPLSRVKIVDKLTKQFIFNPKKPEDIYNCGQGKFKYENKEYSWCGECIIDKVIAELK